MNISLKFVPKRPISNIPTLVSIMAWGRRGDKPLSEPIMLVYRFIYVSRGLNDLTLGILIITMRPKQNDRHFADIFKYISWQKSILFWLEFHCPLFLEIQSKIVSVFIVSINNHKLIKVWWACRPTWCGTMVILFNNRDKGHLLIPVKQNNNHTVFWCGGHTLVNHFF